MFLQLFCKAQDGVLKAGGRQLVRMQKRIQHFLRDFNFFFAVQDLHEDFVYLLLYRILQLPKVERVIRQIGKQVGQFLQLCQQEFIPVLIQCARQREKDFGAVQGNRPVFLQFFSKPENRVLEAHRRQAVRIQEFLFEFIGNIDSFFEDFPQDAVGVSPKRGILQLVVADLIVRGVAQQPRQPFQHFQHGIILCRKAAGQGGIDLVIMVGNRPVLFQLLGKFRNRVLECNRRQLVRMQQRLLDFLWNRYFFFAVQEDLRQRADDLLLQIAAKAPEADFLVWNFRNQPADFFQPRQQLLIPVFTEGIRQRKKYRPVVVYDHALFVELLGKPDNSVVQTPVIPPARGEKFLFQLIQRKLRVRGFFL